MTLRAPDVLFPSRKATRTLSVQGKCACNQRGAWPPTRAGGMTMRRFLPVCALAATLGPGACDDETDVERSVVGGLAGCIAEDINDKGNCAETAAAGAAASALANDV